MGTPGRPPLQVPPSFTYRRDARRLPRVLAGALAAAALAGLWFLLFGAGDSQLSGPVAQAATVSSRAAGYRMRMRVEMTSSASSTPITATGQGVVDLRDRATSMSMTMNLGDSPQVIQQLGSSRMRIDMIATRSVVYVKMPSALTSSLPTSGRQWIKVDVAKLSGLPGLSSLAGNPTTSDPSQVLQSLRSVADGVINAGRQRVDGVETTHYQAALSLAQLTAHLPGAERSAAAQALSTLRQALPAGGFPVDVWIDAHHLVRRIVIVVALSLPDGSSAQERVRVDLSDYGDQRPPAPPPPAQVMDLSTLAGAST